MVRNIYYLATLVFVIVGCGGGNDKSDGDIIENYSETVAPYSSGETPFTHFYSIAGSDIQRVSKLSYAIHPKSGYIAKPVSISYSTAYLAEHGLITADKIILPIVGLYEDYENSVTIAVKYRNLENQHQVSIITKRFESADGLNYRPEVIKKAEIGHTLDFNYFFLKRINGGPLVYDIDGEIRWTTNMVTSAVSTIFDKGKFIIGGPKTASIINVELFGRTENFSLLSNKYTNYHHNIEKGKYGYLFELDATGPEGANIESVLVDGSHDGIIYTEFDFATILSEYMKKQGDDPSPFVRSGKDWFHMNSAVYDASDNSIIASSRENFVIKIDYDTKEIKWVFGDPTKYWYTFNSLAKLAILMDEPAQYPVGQHALSLDSKGDMLLFDNGGSSFNQPQEAPRGISKSYSAARKYRIDAKLKKATNIFTFDYAQNLLSDICSSVYEMAGGSMLINFANSDKGLMSATITPRHLGLGKNGAVEFEFKLNSPGYCGMGWNSDFINFENLTY